MWIAQLIVGLAVVSYFTFAWYSAYMVSIGKLKDDATWAGKVIYRHGQGFIVALIAMAVLSGALVFANIILSQLSAIPGG